MMLDRMEGNAELKTSVQQMLATRRLTHSVLLVGEAGLGTGFAARCIAADYLYPAGGAAAEALLRGECCRAVAKAGKRDSGTVETGIVREAISVSGMGSGGKYLVGQVTAMRSEIFNTSLSAEGRAVLLYHVERMNEESANALLKVMEEPPEGVLFLLTADSLAGVLPTIRSRCVSFAVAPVSPADCTRYCAAQGVDKKTAALYSELFDGHIGTVLAVARDEARTAVNMEPNNYAYQNLLDQLQNPGQSYAGSQQPYAQPSGNPGRFCLSFWLYMMFCQLLSCCCTGRPGGFFFC